MQWSSTVELRPGTMCTGTDKCSGIDYEMRGRGANAEGDVRMGEYKSTKLPRERAD